jgi:hypothetical protein
VQQQQRGGFRRFLQTAPGKALLIAITILVTFASFVYVDTLIAIPAFLLFGLAIPIWVGLKSPRYLAISGLVVVLLVAPIANAVITQEVLTPLGTSASDNVLPYGNGGSVMQGAIVSPYTGSTSTNFTWTVDVYPQYLPGGSHSYLDYLELFVSTCPGATTPNSPSCSTPYPFHVLNQTLPATNATNTTLIPVTFHFVIGSENIWEWQMTLAFVNGTSNATNFIPLVGDPTYNGIEGPVVGTYSSVYAALIGTLYIDDLLFLGLPFYIVLLVYLVFKSFQRRRQQRSQDMSRHAAEMSSGGSASPAAPSGPGPGSSTSSPAASSGASAPVATEGACPKCGAVVYANETTCWKCGAPLEHSSSGSPLPSGPGR